MATPIHVVDDAGNSYWVDPTLLTDAAMPTTENTIQSTNDGQIYQLVNGQWYRVLRTDRVSWNTDVKPNIGQHKSQVLGFALGQAAGYAP